MVRVQAMGAVDRGFEPHSVKTKNHEIGICCFSCGVKQKSLTHSVESIISIFLIHFRK